MRIIIDVRALMHGKSTGVTTYLKELLDELKLSHDEHEYVLFYNSFRKVEGFSADKYLIEGKISLCVTRIPNFLLNFLLAVFKYPLLDKLIARKINDARPFDVFFMPDPRPLAVSKKVKVVTTFHDLSFHHYARTFNLKTRLWHQLLRPRYLARRSDKILAVSVFTKGDLIKTYQTDQDKVRVVYHGVNRAFLMDLDSNELNKVKKKYALPDGFFLTLSAIEPRKNIDKLIFSFKEFSKKNRTDLNLVVAGVEQNDVFSKLKLPLLEQVFMVGFIDENDKPALYKLASGFVYISSYEGFGLPVLEAMATGCPVMISKNSAMSEIVPAEAIQVDPLNNDSLIEGWEKLVNLNEKGYLREVFKKQAEKFSWQKTWLKTLEEMNSFISASGNSL